MTFDFNYEFKVSDRPKVYTPIYHGECLLAAWGCAFTNLQYMYLRWTEGISGIKFKIALFIMIDSLLWGVCIIIIKPTSVAW